MTEKKMLLPTDPKVRKAIPITEGVLDYFPLAIADVAKCSHAGNEQHNPGKPLHWDRSKSTDHANCIGRHLIDRGTFDTDGVRHSAKLAWRALALLQTELEEEGRTAMLEKQVDGWIIWDGGECPVDPKTLVCVKFADDDISGTAHSACNYYWEHSGTPGDIIAYKVIE